MSQFTRRSFLKSSLAAAGVFAIGGTKSSGRVIGANDTIRLGVAGLHGRGGSHVDGFAGMKGVQVIYLIDPDTRTFAGRVKTVEAKGGNTPKCVQDVREALSDKNLDALTIATPNHWHSLMTIWACQAGKDVYVEKPCSHNVHEGRIAVETARKYKRIVQHGTQARSNGLGDKIQALAKAGTLGKLLISRGLCYKGRPSIGKKDPSPAPEQVDFNLWLGPAPEQPHHGNLVHYNWHWFWDFGNGDIGNQGVHEMDKARWGIAGATLPKSVMSLGGRLGYTDQGETPNTQIALFDYGETKLVFEVRGLKTDDYYGQKVGNSYHFEHGVVAGDKFFPQGKKESQPVPWAKTEATGRPGGGIFGNFIAAMRSRNHNDLDADILEGHYSSALCHLANISYRLGTLVPFNKERRSLGEDTTFYDALARMEEHLSNGNGVKLDGRKYRLGRTLAFHRAHEHFADDDEANQLLTRNYRKPFVVPERVA